MISVNALISNAFKRCNLVEDGGVPNGTQSANALEDLQCLIAELNGEDDMLDNVETFDCDACERIKFAKKPERWFEVSSVEDIQARIDAGKCLVYDIFKVGQTFYVIHPDGSGLTYVTDEDWSRAMALNYWPQFFVAEVPDRIIGCGRQIGYRYVQLYPVDKMTVDASNKMSLSSMYTSETETVEVPFPHLEDDPNYQPYILEYFVIEFNSIQSSSYRITVLKGIPRLEITDTLHISSKYEGMLEDGLCMKLCLRYSSFEKMEKFEREFEGAKRNIMRINVANRPMTYNFVQPRGWADNYYNLAGGVGF